MAFIHELSLNLIKSPNGLCVGRFPLCVCASVCVKGGLRGSSGWLEGTCVMWLRDQTHTVDKCESRVGSALFLQPWSVLGCSLFITQTHTCCFHRVTIRERSSTFIFDHLSTFVLHAYIWVFVSVVFVLVMRSISCVELKPQCLYLCYMARGLFSSLSTLCHSSSIAILTENRLCVFVDSECM